MITLEEERKLKNREKARLWRLAHPERTKEIRMKSKYKKLGSERKTNAVSGENFTIRSAAPYMPSATVVCDPCGRICLVKLGCLFCSRAGKIVV